MNKILLDTLLQWPRPFITGDDLKVIINRSEDARKAIIKRAVREKWLTRVKQDLYLTGRSSLPNNFELAQLIWGPSYISFESALSFHQWIPEAVYTTTSSCIKRSKTVDTCLGTFSFNKIPESIFPVGVFHHKEFLIAHPWKAIADLIFTNKKDWTDANALSEDLRIEQEMLKQSDLPVLQFLAKHYPHQHTKKILNNLLTSLEQ